MQPWRGGVELGHDRGVRVRRDDAESGRAESGRTARRHGLGGERMAVGHVGGMQGSPRGDELGEDRGDGGGAIGELDGGMVDGRGGRFRVRAFEPASHGRQARTNARVFIVVESGWSDQLDFVRIDALALRVLRLVYSGCRLHNC